MNKRAIITGVAGAIGTALVQEFQRQGIQVFGLDKVPKPAHLDIDNYLQLDLQELVTKSPNAREEMLDEILIWIGSEGLDVLVNNAAIQNLASVEDLELGAWQSSMNVNLLAPFFLVKAFLPSLSQVKGSVVNVSSVHARLTKSGFIAYATSKAALSGMTRAMAVELGNRIRVNAVEPASIQTPMLSASFQGQDERLLGLAECHPQGRIGSPEEVAALVYAIAMGNFKFLNGACIDMSGGISARLHDIS